MPPPPPFSSCLSDAFWGKLFHPIACSPEAPSPPERFPPLCFQNVKIALMPWSWSCCPPSLPAVAPIGTPTLQYCTALHLAALHGHLAAVEALLEAPGCDVNARNADGATPLHMAAFAGESQVLPCTCGWAWRLLCGCLGMQLCRGVVGALPLGNLLVLPLCQMQHGHIVQHAVHAFACHALPKHCQSNPHLRAPLPPKQTNPLLSVPSCRHTSDRCRRGRAGAQVVACLCRAPGACLDARDHLGRTPLHVAAAMDWDDVVVELWAKGAAIDMPDVHGWTGE